MNNNGGGACSLPRHMVMFRPPSRHTYGFVNEHSDYDLPEIKLQHLLRSTNAQAVNYNGDVRFIPVENSCAWSHRDGAVPRQEATDKDPRRGGVTSNNQREKKIPARCSLVGSNKSLLQWMVNANGIMLSDDEISLAASRAVLTHATFSINEFLLVTEKDWGWEEEDSCIGNHHPLTTKVLHRLEFIDMSNPNRSRDERTQLLNKILQLFHKREPEVRLRLQKWISTRASLHHVQGRQPVVIVVHHGFPVMNQIQKNNKPSVHGYI